jgi:hypothetical protein
MKLLDTKGGNTKVKKSMAMGDVRIASLSLEPTPALCPHSAIAECFDNCIKKSGMAQVFSSVTQSRMAKTRFFESDRERFLIQLKRELHNFIKLCLKQGVKPVVRLNTFSDVKWEELLDMEGEFGEILFYDYTKNAARLHTELPSNYKLMFSYSGAPRYQKHVAKALEADVPMTVVFRGGFPESFMGRPVIDGDVSDLDNVFSGNVIVGLRVKGDEAKKDVDSPFIVDATNLIAVAV